MPSDRPVSIVVWRDAKKEPPEHEHQTLTSNGEGFHDPEEREWLWPADADGDALPMNPQPQRWAEMPVPPSEDALTLDDLRVAVGALLHASGDGVVIKSQCRTVAIRLRRALEQVEGT